MKNFMVANMVGKDAEFRGDKVDTLLKAQIENSIELGWQPEDIVLLASFDYEFMGVKAIKADLNEFCWTGSKLFGLKWWFDNNGTEDVLWAHDLDCWQNVRFDCPEFETDVGGVQYSNPKWQGGSIFWKSSSKDIVEEIVRRLVENKEVKEEPMLNKVFKSKEYGSRVTCLDSTYNVGCSGFAPRYTRSIKPIRVCHFHPNNRIAWELHALDTKELGERAITVRLERLLRRRYENLPTKRR